MCFGENKRKLTMRTAAFRMDDWMKKEFVSNASLMKCSFFSFTYSIGPVSYGCCFCSFSIHSRTFTYLFFLILLLLLWASEWKKVRSKIIVVLYTIPFAVVPIFSHLQFDDAIFTFRMIVGIMHKFVKGMNSNHYRHRRCRYCRL